MKADPFLGEHADDIAVAAEAGAALCWARVMRQAGAAVSRVVVLVKA